MTTTLFSVPTTHGSPFPQRCCRWYHSPATLITTPSKLILHCSPLSTSVVEEGASDAQSEYSVKLPLRGCKACGREDIEKGCNGEGRIQGGIATVPGFGWWPIKAYRPCPGFVASGGRYRRRGQSMDEVAFGRVERSASMGANNEVKSSKKKQSPKNFKK